MIDWTAVRKAAIGDAHRQIVPSGIKLPALPRALTLFCKKAEDDSASTLELAAIIESDAALTTELLRYVNSAQFGLRHRASTAQQALALLGIRNTKLMLVTAGAKMATAARQSRLVNIKNFWNVNLERALFAREVAVLLKADADVAFAGGMLQDLLLPIITNELFDKYLPFFEKPETHAEGLTGYEQATFGWTHVLAGGHVMYDWGFPDDLVCTVLHHHRGLAILLDPVLGKTAVAAVALSSLLPDSVRQVPHSFDLLVRLEQAWPAFRLDDIADRIAAQFAELVPGVKYEFSLQHHCQKRAAHTAAREPASKT